MQEIRQTGLPPLGAHWSMGERYMRRISRASAVKLLDQYPVPRVGYETTAVAVPDGFGGLHRLTVQNVGGQYYVASCTVQVASWPDVFGVTVKG